MTLMGGIGVYSRGAQFAWRGMASIDYSLTSSLHRRLASGHTEEQVAEAERAILRSAREWGLGAKDGRVLSDVQLLADLQHFGTPTRLVDFTNNPMTALWFACQPTHEGLNDLGRSLSPQGLLLAVNRSQFRERQTERTAPSYTWGDLAGSDTDWSGGPQVIQASVQNDRLRAQEGYFIAGETPAPGLRRRFSPLRAFDIPHSKGDPEHLERQLTEAHRRPGKPRNVPFVAITIPTRVKKRMLDVLRASYNRTASVMFPDFEGFRLHGVDSVLDSIS